MSSSFVVHNNDTQISKITTQIYFFFSKHLNLKKSRISGLQYNIIILRNHTLN